jgi:hypothetical protein
MMAFRAVGAAVAAIALALVLIAVVSSGNSGTSELVAKTAAAASSKKV